jgi:GTPase Era involved in 16S rRNA processing
VRRAKKKGTFKINHDQTVELLEITVKLMSMRSSLLEGVAKIKRTLIAIRRNQKPVVAWQERRIKSILEEARQNLRKAGYP